MSSPAVPWQRLLTVKILLLHALKSFLDSCTQMIWSPSFSPLYLLWTDCVEKFRLQEYLYCCESILCCAIVSTEPLPRNAPGISAHVAVVAKQRLFALHFSLLKIIRLEWPTGVPPFLLSDDCACDACAWSNLPRRGSVFTVITLQPLPLLPP
jgi:hypothetical protein